MPVPIDIIGHVTNGEQPDLHIRVIDDTAESGGFFILSWWPGPNEALAQQAFDNWVQSVEELEQFFAESGWVIEWLA